MDNESLEQNGYTLLPFKEQRILLELQALVRSFFPCEPTEWHQRNVGQEEHLRVVKGIIDEMTKRALVTQLIKDNLKPFINIMGPDLDIQVVPYLRVSRPSREADLVDWHRDTFYGNTPWEMNFWFPLFALQEGAGLTLLRGSHIEPSTNVRLIEEQDTYRSQVKKGSVANKVGYAYMPKTDDTIAQMDPARVQLITPPLGSGVLFFGCMAHRAINLSQVTRVSIDIRIRNSYTIMHARPDYYVPLCRGVVESCISRFLGSSAQPKILES